MIAGWAAPDDRVLPRVLRRRAAERPDGEFLRIEDGPTETFGQVLEAAERVAGQLAALGTGPGDLVPLLADTSAEPVHAWLGVNLAGAADVPLNTAYRGASLAHGLNLCRSRLMIADPSFLPRIAEVAPGLPALETIVLLGEDPAPDPAAAPGLRLVPLAAAAGPVPDATVLAGDGVTYRDTASVLFTSGTTGSAKGVIMTHAQTYAIAQEIVDGLRVTERNLFYCFHPMFHMTRFGSVYAALLAGCPVVLDRRFDPAAFLDRARRYGATATIGHGPMLEAISCSRCGSPTRRPTRSCPRGRWERSPCGPVSPGW